MMKIYKIIKKIKLNDEYYTNLELDNLERNLNNSDLEYKNDYELETFGNVLNDHLDTDNANFIQAINNHELNQFNSNNAIDINLSAPIPRNVFGNSMMILHKSNSVRINFRDQEVINKIRNTAANSRQAILHQYFTWPQNATLTNNFEDFMKSFALLFIHGFTRNDVNNFFTDQALNHLQIRENDEQEKINIGVLFGSFKIIAREKAVDIRLSKIFVLKLFYFLE